MPNYLRSRNESDTQYINGLYAGYYSLGGVFQFDVYGEGPLAHGWDSSPLQTHYQNETNHLWGGVYSSWVTFEERLSGAIFIGADPPDPNATPEPGSLTLLGLGLAVFASAALRRRFMRAH